MYKWYKTCYNICLYILIQFDTFTDTVSDTIEIFSLFLRFWNENFLRFLSFFPVLLVKNMIKYNFTHLDTVYLYSDTVFIKNFVYF